MARSRNGPPEPAPYQLLGVARQATLAEIAQAWRYRARAQHPDVRPADSGAPARFRALAGAYEMLGDPDRRAAYDQAARVTESGSRPPRPAAGTAVRVIVLPPSGPLSPPADAAPTARGATLWAGQVRMEPPDATPTRYLDGTREWPW